MHIQTNVQALDRRFLARLEEIFHRHIALLVIAPCGLQWWSLCHRRKPFENSFISVAYVPLKNRRLYEPRTWPPRYNRDGPKRRRKGSADFDLLAGGTALRYRVAQSGTVLCSMAGPERSRGPVRSITSGRDQPVYRTRCTFTRPGGLCGADEKFRSLAHINGLNSEGGFWKLGV